MAYANKKKGAVAGKAGLPAVDETDPRIQRLVEEVQAQVKESELSPVKLVSYVAAAIAGLFAVLGILTLTGRFQVLWLTGPDWFIIALMGFLGPVGIVRSREDKRIREIEERLPDFLRDVAEGGRFGMTLA